MHYGMPQRERAAWLDSQTRSCAAMHTCQLLNVRTLHCTFDQVVRLPEPAKGLEIASDRDLVRADLAKHLTLPRERLPCESLQ